MADSIHAASDMEEDEDEGDDEDGGDEDKDVSSALPTRFRDRMDRWWGED